MKKRISLLLTALLVISMTVPVFANSAVRYTLGSSTAGVVLKNEDCPIEVLKEALTFAPIDAFNDWETDLAYGDLGTVTAEYTLYNPSDREVTVDLVFPFGVVPHYIRDTGEFVSHAVKADGEDVDVTLRNSYATGYYDFDLERDVAYLQDDFVSDAFYAPDLPVTELTYEVREIPEDMIWGYAQCEIPSPGENTVVLLKHSGSYSDNGEEFILSVGAENDRDIKLYFIGEYKGEVPEFGLYDDWGEAAQKVPGSVTLKETASMTLLELAKSYLPENRTVSDIDIYNAFVFCAREEYSEFFSAEGYFEWYDTDFTARLLHWYEYRLTLAPGQTLINTVTAPLCPDIDYAYRAPEYEYTYLLSPAKTWADFGTLDVVINTDMYMSSDNGVEYTKTKDGYTAHFDSLPKRELSFTLRRDRLPLWRAEDIFKLLVLLSPLIAIVTVVLVIIKGIRKRRKQKN